MIEMIAAVIGLGLILAAGRRLASGTEVSDAGFFPNQRPLGWPRGVQEEDVPRFVFRTAD